MCQAQLLLVFRTSTVLQSLSKTAAGKWDTAVTCCHPVTLPVILVTPPGLMETALHCQPWEHAGILSIHGVTSGI